MAEPGAGLLRAPPRLASALLVAALLLATAGPSLLASPAGPAPPTPGQLFMLGVEVQAYLQGGAIDGSGVAGKLEVLIAQAQQALKNGDPQKAAAIITTFVATVRAQRPAHIVPSAAQSLVATATRAAQPTTITVHAGAAATVATLVGSSPVVVTLPAGTTITRLTFTGEAHQVPAPPPGSGLLALIGVGAFDSSGHRVVQLPGPARISITFFSSPAFQAQGGVMLSVNPTTGLTETLPTQVVRGGGGTHTATAPTRHLSPFAVSVPLKGSGPGGTVASVQVAP